jgi:hypothetical protein
MKDAGYPGLMIGQEYGGEGGGLLEGCIVVEEVSAAEPSLGLMLVNHLACCAGIGLWASEEKKMLFLPPLASGRSIGAVALTEPEAGTDVCSIRARLEKGPGCIKLNGNKCFVTNTWPGADSSVLGFFKGPSGLAAALIPSSARGFHLAHLYRFAGWDNLPNHALVLQDCTLDDQHLIHDDLPRKALENCLDLAMVLTSALVIGMGRACMDEATRYCRQRKQFGKYLIEHQALQFRLSDIATALENMQTSVRLAASALDRGESHHSEICMLKLFETGKLEEIASSAVEMAGGYGYSEDCRLSRLYRDCKGVQLLWGSRELMRLEIARGLGLIVGHEQG